MALMFQRLARNFIKNGYFPTDEDSIRRILAMLQPACPGLIRMVDTCCGEGIALAECAHHFRDSGSQVHSSGVEFDKERAYHAKSLLDFVVHSDFESVVMSLNQFQLMWLNPPYGDRISKGFEGSDSGGRDRLEKLFLSKSLPGLNFGGLLIFIIPHYVLDKSLSGYLARSLSDVSVFQLPEQRFKQVVILGYRKKQEFEPGSEIIRLLREVGENISAAPVLPEEPSRLYPVPVSPPKSTKEFVLRTIEFDPDQFLEIKTAHPCLWGDFPKLFGSQHQVRRQPARRPSPWHLSLMLAAGMVSGVVTSESGRSLLVKGGTHKEKSRRSTIAVDDDGNSVETITLTDVFVPIIKGIDVTPDGEFFGDVFTIR
jgi:methylase of polypeptide subunit release factors